MNAPPPPIKCDACTRLLAASATRCPHCGHQSNAQFEKEWEGRHDRPAPPNITIEPKAALQSIHPDNPPLTCTQFLEHARDSADAMLSELQEANKTASGMASLLLLDMIENARVMAARIRQIISAASNEAAAPVGRDASKPQPPFGNLESRRLDGQPGGKGTEAPDAQG